LPGRITHKRTVCASPATLSFSITDEFRGRPGAKHSFEVIFITPFTTVDRLDRSTVLIRGDKSRQLVLGGADHALQELSLEPINWFPGYGMKSSASLIQFKYQSYLPFKTTTVISSTRSLFSAESQLRRAEADLKHRFSFVRTEA
jgi:hypothetical protein